MKASFYLLSCNAIQKSMAEEPLLNNLFHEYIKTLYEKFF